MHEYAPPKEIEPTVEDLMDYAKANLAKKALARYFFTANPERTVRRHERLGTPLIRAAVMGTIGRFAPRNQYGWSNYRLDKSKRPIDAAISFATSGTIVNEVIHTGAAAQNISLIAADVMSSVDHHVLTANGYVGVGALALNTALVALQRYNRARMLVRVNEELAAGESFTHRAENWTGVDSRSEDAFDNENNPGVEERLTPGGLGH